MPIKRIKQKIKKHFHEVLEIKTTPNEIALGFAVGTGIALLPTFGLGFLIGLLVVLIFKNVSKLSMLIAFAVWNPLFLIPITTLSYFIGDMILADEPITRFRFELLNQFYTYSLRYLIGNLIITIIATVVSYSVVFYLVRKYQKKEIPILQKPLDLHIEPVLQNPVLQKPLDIHLEPVLKNV